jgi:hypothetical protein
LSGEDDIKMVKAGIEAVSSSALSGVNNLLLRLFGPAADEAGLMLNDHVRVFRAKRQLRLYLRTAEKLEEAGITPQQVPLKLLFPIVENASIEESDELQDRWANLLARASDPKEADLVELSFPTILRELSSRDVKFLDELFKEAHRRANARPHRDILDISFGDAELHTAFSNAGLARHPIQQRLTMAQRGITSVQADGKDIGFCMDVFARNKIVERMFELPSKIITGANKNRNMPELDDSFRFTHLGIKFTRACNTPPLKSKTIQAPPE